MDKLRTAMGVLVGTILGIECGISFKSMVVGISTATCYSILFIHIFNKVKRTKK